MPFFESNDARIHYEVAGQGEPVFTIAPGGMRSAHELWEGQPWDPRQLAADYTVIGMDQRNAGRSTAPVSGQDGWHTYAADQLAILDHLGVEKCHVIGMCIGGPYITGLLRAAPERFASAVLLQPVGIDDNRAEMRAMFDDWASKIIDDHPEAAPADWEQFRSNMWDGEFVLTATPRDVAAMSTPMLVAMGNDVFHPAATSRQIAELAPNAQLIEHWREPEHVRSTDSTIRAFLAAHALST
jgi:pimeloyl-ACP methyl ester carboxylesterase